MIARVAALDTTQAPVFALDQVPLESIAAAEGTPCYVYSAPVVSATPRRACSRPWRTARGLTRCTTR